MNNHRLTSEDNKCIDKESVTDADLKFLAHCRQFGFGKLQVDVKNGQPVGSWPVVVDGIVQHYTKYD